MYLIAKINIATMAMPLMPNEISSTHQKHMHKVDPVIGHG
jgi:hypothetical protein